MRTASLGPRRQPTFAAARPYGDATCRRQEGVRPENQQVSGFPRTRQLPLASLSLAKTRGGRRAGRHGSSPGDPRGGEPSDSSRQPG